MRDEPNLHRRSRYLIILPVAFEAEGTPTSEAGSGWTRNLSEGGACLELTESLTPGTALSLALRTEDESLLLQAEVAWVGHPGLPSGATLHGVSIHPSTPDRRQRFQSLLRDAMGVDARKARIPVALLARCHSIGAPEAPLGGWTGDLSQQGCSLLLPDRLPVGTLLELTLPCAVDPRSQAELTLYQTAYRRPR